MIKYAQDNKIQFGTYGSLTQAPEIKQLIQKEVDRVNKTLAQVEQVKKFTIIPKRLYEEDGEVTPTMKVKRKFINETYKDIIEKMYQEQVESLSRTNVFAIQVRNRIAFSDLGYRNFRFDMIYLRVRYSNCDFLIKLTPAFLFLPPLVPFHRFL